MNGRYEKFRETKQAALKLRIALEEYFREEADTGSPPRETEEETAKEWQDYEAYLRRRVRPAAEELMEQNRIEAILQMEEMGWLDGGVLEQLIAAASEKNKTACWMALVKRKGERYGFGSRDFSLEPEQ